MYAGEKHTSAKTVLLQAESKASSGPGGTYNRQALFLEEKGIPGPE